MGSNTTVVLGGGIGGVVAAKELRRRLPSADQVVLVERHDVLRFAPSLLWVMTGARKPEQIQRNLGRLSRAGLEVVKAEVLGVDPSAGTVKTTDGSIEYDRLVIALGASLAPDTLPGFSDGAHNIYTTAGALGAGDALRSINGGRVVVLVSSMPYKCPAAPYEAAFFAETILRHRGVRDAVSVEVHTPEPFPMPAAGPDVGGALRGMLEARGIGFIPEHPVQTVDAGASELVFEDGRVSYDVLLGVPPHRPPAVLAESGLVNGSYLPVDRATLATDFDGIWAVGDATAVPIADGKMLPKAGVFAEREAQVVARRIADELAGREPTATFNGHGACFLEVGDGKAAIGKGDFYAERGPEVTLHPPARRWHLAKVALEKLWFRRWV